MTTKNYNQELNNIYNFINDYFRVDIADKNRSAHYVNLRTLFYKIATEETLATTSVIASVVNRDHSTIVHARKYHFDYIMEVKDIRDAYNSYFGITPSVDVSDIKEDTLELTENEKAYRKLSLEDRKKYDERVSLLLKSFKWKEYNSTFETINVGISSN